MGRIIYGANRPAFGRNVHGAKRTVGETSGNLPFQRSDVAALVTNVVLVHRVLHGNAPECLGPFTWLSNVPGRSSLRSASSNHLLIPPVRRSTILARGFTVSGPALRNSLPSDITSIDSLPVSSASKQLFILSFVSRRCSITVLFCRGLEAFYVALGHVNLIRN